jgi:hypothetical protein
MERMKKHMSPALVISCVALFVALSGSVYAAGLAKNSVKAKNIAKGAVTNPKLKNGAVTAKKLANNSVIGSKIANEAVGASKLGDASVRSNALGGGVVTSPKLKDLSVITAKIGNAAVGKDQLGASAVETGKLATEAVTAEKIAAGLYSQLLKNVDYETAESVSDNSAEPKGTTALCPNGKVAIGGGARIEGEGVTTVAITQSAPSFSETTGKAVGWFAQARPINPEADAWKIVVHAVCVEV